MHHDGSFCQGSRLGRQPAPRSKHLPIMCWDHHPPPQWKCARERRKTPYSLDINLTSTQLSKAANRRVLNRLSYSSLRIGLTTSRCASLHHARDLSSVFSKILSTFNQDHHCFVAECCTHFPQLLGRERKEKLKLGLKLGKALTRIPNKYRHIWSGFFVTSFPSSPRYANLKSTQNDLQYRKKFWQAKWDY